MEEAVIAPAPHRLTDATWQCVGGFPGWQAHEERCLEGQRDRGVGKCRARIVDDRRGIGHRERRLRPQLKETRLHAVIDDDGRRKVEPTVHGADGENIDGMIVVVDGEHGPKVTHRRRNAAQATSERRPTLHLSHRTDGTTPIAHARFAWNQDQ